MSDKWILVTGGSRGIGRATVQRLVQEWNVVFTWYQGEKESLDVHLACNGSSGWVESHQCDGRDERAVSELASDLLARHGSPYAIVHNAGVTFDALHIYQNADNWRRVMDTNLNAIYYWNHCLLPSMMEQGEGAVIMMSSVTGIKGNSGQCAYGASKAAMIGLGRSLSIELGRFGVRVNCLLPGYIESDMLAAVPIEKLKSIRKDIPLKRFGKADEVAGAVAWLVSDASAYMTGQTLILDGGLSA